MAGPKCQCHLMLRKCKPYYYQPASDFICEACMNVSIVTIRKRQMRDNAANQPPAMMRSIASSDSFSDPSDQPWKSVLPVPQLRKQSQRKPPGVLPATNTCNSRRGQQNSRDSPSCKTQAAEMKSQMRIIATTPSPAIKLLTQSDSFSGPSVQPCTSVLPAPQLRKQSQRPPTPGVLPATSTCNSTRDQQNGRDSPSYKTQAAEIPSQSTKLTTSSNPAISSLVTKVNSSPIVASLSAKEFATAATTAELHQSLRSAGQRVEPRSCANDDSSMKSNSVGADSSCWEDANEAPGKVAGDSFPTPVREDSHDLRLGVPIVLSESNDSSLSRSGSSSSVSRTINRALPEKRRHRRSRCNQLRRRWRPIVASRVSRCLRWSPPRQRDPSPHRSSFCHRCASSSTSQSSSSLSSTPSPTDVDDGGCHQQSNMSAADSAPNSSGCSMTGLVDGEVGGGGGGGGVGGSIEGGVFDFFLPNHRPSSSLEPPKRRSEMRDFRTQPQKAEPLTMVEKAIMDYFSTHKGDSAPRVLPGLADGQWPTDSSRLLGPADSQPVAQLTRGHVLKDSIVIGETSIFEQYTSRQFILPMFDKLLEAFFKDSSILRAVCNRTRCRVELSRRILNRRVLHGSWIKYMTVTITGPASRSIDNCDRALKKQLPAYRLRRLYDKETTCCLYLNEDTPDNAELCFSHQRTGVATTCYGNLKLQSPFFKLRRPWSAGLVRYGRATVASKQSSDCVRFVYANALQKKTGIVPSDCTGVTAIGVRQAMQDAATELGHAVIENRKRMLLTLNRV